LILKIIGLQEIANLVKAQTDMSYCSFFNYNVNRQESAATVAEEGEKTDQSITTYTNRRNMYWAINYLRILQMLTKHKTHRVMLLVQYKSAVCLYVIIFVVLLEMLIEFSGHFKAVVKNISSCV
jgi:hypothetical protein